MANITHITATGFLDEMDASKDGNEMYIPPSCNEVHTLLVKCAQSLTKSIDGLIYFNLIEDAKLTLDCLIKVLNCIQKTYYLT